MCNKSLWWNDLIQVGDKAGQLVEIVEPVLESIDRSEKETTGGSLLS